MRLGRIAVDPHQVRRDVVIRKLGCKDLRDGRCLGSFDELHLAVAMGADDLDFHADFSRISEILLTLGKADVPVDALAICLQLIMTRIAA